MSEANIELIIHRLGELEKKVDEVRADQRAMRDRPPCPDPGACIVLKRDIDVMKENEKAREERLRSLETTRDEARGVGIAAKAVWAFIGAGGLGVLFAVFKFAGG